jgi:hypothetical protein
MQTLPKCLNKRGALTETSFQRHGQVATVPKPLGFMFFLLLLECHWPHFVSEGNEV